MSGTLGERLQRKTEEAIAANDASEQGTREVKEGTTVRAKPKEKVGTGQSSFDLDGAIARIRERIAATQDPERKAKLKARIAALKANAQ